MRYQTIFHTCISHSIAHAHFYDTLVVISNSRRAGAVEVNFYGLGRHKGSDLIWST